MKTSKITLTLAAMNLALFMSVSSTAIPFNSNTGDIINGVTKQIGVAKSNLSEITSAEISGNEFNYLAFDVTQLDIESGIAELPVHSLERLRFEVNSFSDVTENEISELPVMNEFDYLRFYVNEFVGIDQMTEMPANEFDYLRFDANEFISTDNLNEMPVKEIVYLRFDVNDFVGIDQMTEMPFNEFDYLRFDLNKFVCTNQMTEMPVKEFEYLRFDVNEFVGTDQMTEVPVNEFDYLRFDINRSSTDFIGEIDELPACL